MLNTKGAFWALVLSILLAALILAQVIENVQIKVNLNETIDAGVQTKLFRIDIKDKPNCSQIKDDVIVFYNISSLSGIIKEDTFEREIGCWGTADTGYWNATAGSYKLCGSIVSTTSENSNLSDDAACKEIFVRGLSIIPIVNQTNQTNQTQGPTNQTNQTQQVNQTQQQQNQTSATAAYLKITDVPINVNFGSVSQIKATFFSNATYEKLLFLIYASPKRIVREPDEAETQITANKIDAKSAVTVENVAANEQLQLSLQFYLYSNCNNYYEEGNYDLFLRVFKLNEKNAWEKLAEEGFSIYAEANPDCVASGITEEETQASQAQTIVTTRAITSNVTAPTKEAKAVQQSRASKAEARPGASKIIYASSIKYIRQIAIWILVFVTAALLYVIWKKKI